MLGTGESQRNSHRGGAITNQYHIRDEAGDVTLMNRKLLKELAGARHWRVTEPERRLEVQRRIDGNFIM